MFRKNKLVYDTTFYSELVAERYLERGGGEMDKAVVSLANAFAGDEAVTIENTSEAEAFATELFGTLIDGQGCVKTDKPTKWAQACFEQLEQNTEWQRLQQLCEKRREISAVTTAGLINELKDILATARNEEENPNSDGQGDGNGNQPSGGLSQQQQQAIERAVDEAVGTAEKAESAYGSLAGTGMGTNEKSDADIAAKEALLKQLRDNNYLASMLDLVGKMQSITKAKLAQTEEKQVLLADIEYGNDLKRLSGFEKANLAMPETELLFLKRYAERKLMLNRASGRSNVGRGDILLLLDESGSMQGTRATMSKAFCVAVVQMAIKQKRKVTVIGFDTNPRYEFTFTKGSCKASLVGRRYQTSNECAAADAISSIMSFVPNGGTSFGRVMRYVLDYKIKTNKDADVLMITDACDSMPDNICYELETKYSDLRNLGVVIGGYGIHDTKIRHPWLDHVWCTDCDPENLIENLTNLAVEAIK